MRKDQAGCTDPEPGHRKELTVPLGSNTWITDHAIRRFIQRIQPAADPWRAKGILREACFVATRLPDPPFLGKGGVLWAVEDPAMRLVTKHDRRMGCAILVTVLAAEDAPEEPEDPTLAGLWAECQRSLPEPPALPPPPAPTKVARGARHDAVVVASRAARKPVPGKTKPVDVGRAKRRAEHEAFIALAEKRREDRRLAKLGRIEGTCALCGEELVGVVAAWRRVDDGAAICVPCGEGLDAVLYLGREIRAA